MNSPLLLTYSHQSNQEIRLRAPYSTRYVKNKMIPTKNRLFELSSLPKLSSKAMMFMLTGLDAALSKKLSIYRKVLIR